MGIIIKNPATELEWETRFNLAAAYQLASKFGWTDLIYSHISARVPGQEDCYFINPFGLHFHEVTASNLIKVSFDGTILDNSPYGINPAGLVIHSALHKARPDAACVMHLHTVAGMAISALKDGLLPITQQACFFYNKIAYHNFEGVLLRVEEQERIIADLQDKNVMILRNHGFLTAGKSISEAFCLMYLLEKAAKAQIAAQSTGRELIIPSDEVCRLAAEQSDKRADNVIEIEWAALLRLLSKEDYNI